VPRYDYECQSCQTLFEVKQGFNDEPVANCPSCHNAARRKFQVVPIIYKGTGFYTTDYAPSNVKANGTTESSDETPSKTSDTDKTDKQDSKPETSKDNKPETSKDNKPDSKPSAPPS